MRRLRFGAAVAAPFVVLALAAFLLLTPLSQPASAAIFAVGRPAHPATTIAVAGDSITAYDDYDARACRDSCVISDRTWTYWAINDGLVLAGGYAASGNKSWETLAQMPIVNADVLVVELGTNNASAGTDPALLVADVDAIVTVSTASVVVIAAIPPHDLAPDLAAANNDALLTYSQANGYTFVDPWAELRDGTHWTPGSSTDGIHPKDVSSFEAAGDRIADAVRSAMNSGSVG